MQTPVAIKRLSSDSQQGSNELHAEIQLLGTCRHENLLALLGFCLAPNALCLVYPLMVGGNLNDRIFLSREAHQRLQSLGNTNRHTALTWRQRLHIMRDVCRALAYLHTPSGTKGVVLHRDIKPMNILLDAQCNPKLSDVGLAKHTQELQYGGRTHLSTSTVAGTPGYIDPLFLHSGQYSQMTDAYAIGVTMLVCLTKLRALHALELEMLETPSLAPRSVDGAAQWPDAVAIAVTELVIGLSWQRTQRRRMPLETASRRLEELATEQSMRPGVIDADRTAQECVVCMSRPRSVRFVCGHSSCCEDCAGILRDRGDPCPNCRAPINVVARGEHLAFEPTYVAAV
jgi:serine/threonine protein kinase